MDELSSVNRNATQTTTNPSSAAIATEQFLTLLVAQLENQDPLSPQDSTEFTSQLALFSMLEQLVAIRAAVEDQSEPETAPSVPPGEAQDPEPEITNQPRTVEA